VYPPPQTKSDCRRVAPVRAKRLLAAAALITAVIGCSDLEPTAPGRTTESVTPLLIALSSSVCGGGAVVATPQASLLNGIPQMGLVRVAAEFNWGLRTLSYLMNNAGGVLCRPIINGEQGEVVSVEDDALTEVTSYLNLPDPPCPPGIDPDAWRRLGKRLGWRILALAAQIAGLLPQGANLSVSVGALIGVSADINSLMENHVFQNAATSLANKVLNDYEHGKRRASLILAENSDSDARGNAARMFLGCSIFQHFWSTYEILLGTQAQQMANELMQALVEGETNAPAITAGPLSVAHLGISVAFASRNLASGCQSIVVPLWTDQILHPTAVVAPSVSTPTPSPPGNESSAVPDSVLR
jgi:hypothetical protein